MKVKIWLVIIPILLFVMLAISIQAGMTVNFEGWAYSEATEHISPVMTSIIQMVTHIGDSAVVIIFCILLFAFHKSRKTIALPVSITVILSSVLNVILKNIFVRERPDILRLINETSYSFPSGHAMINSSLYIILVFFIFQYIKNTSLKYALSAICITLIVAIGFSRVYLGVHYAGDILGGWLFGFAISILVYFLWGRYLKKKNKMDGNK